MRILGLSFYYHDAAAALVIDGRTVAMAEEERFSRQKHDSRYPALAIEFVLAQAGIAASDLDYVVFYEKPFTKFDRILRTSLGTWPFAPAVWASAIRHELESKLWVRSLLSSRLKIEPDKILFSGHHLSHAASAFYPSPFDKAAILTVDGVGEWATTTLAVGEGTRIRFLKELRFPHSLGLLYSAFTAFLGFEVNEGEYKVMGMAPYGKPKYADKVRQLLTAKDDGSFALDMSYFCFDRSLKRTYTRKFVKLFGAPRDPKSKFFTRATGWPPYFGPKPEGEAFEREAERQEFYADVAASVQAVLEERLVALADELHRLTGLESLCLGGGVGLNSVANAVLLSRTRFKNLFVQPAAGDAGGALGAALAAQHLGVGQAKRERMGHAAYGKAYDDAAVAKTLADVGITAAPLGEAQLIETVAQALADGKVVGWFQGRFEWGPRALGSRSILADPRRAEMKDTVNTTIKFREPYRPFAPSVLAEHAKDWFERPEAFDQDPARYMLLVVPVRADRRAQIPAVTHVDGSARPQAVHREAAPRYHALIEAFRRKTGVPVLLNTSFNLKGEPVVNTPLDALRTFARSEMDVLALGERVVRRADLPPEWLAAVRSEPLPGTVVPRSRLAAALRGLGLAVLAAVVLFAALEIGVRLFTKPVYPILRSDPDVGTTHAPDVARYLWNAEAGKDRFVLTNHDGYVGPDRALVKPPDTLRVAFLGDSMTESFQVDYERGFIYLLEQSLNVTRPAKTKRVELMNFGVGGTGTFQQYQTYKKAIAPYRPDVVVLMFHSNDFADNLNKIGYDPDNYRQEMGWRSALKSVLLHSALLKYLYVHLQGSAPVIKALGKVGVIDANDYTASAVGSWWGVNQQKPEFYDFTFGLIQRLRDRAKADGSDFVVIAMPDEPEFSDKSNNWMPFEYNRRLKAFLAKAAITFINPSADLYAAKQEAGTCLQYNCNGHFNDLGHEALAHALFPVLAAWRQRLP